MHPLNVENDLDELTLDFNRSYIKCQTMVSVREVLRKQTRLHRRYAAKQLRSYEKWVELSHKRLHSHRRTQQILRRLGAHNDSLREYLDSLKRKRIERKYELQARRAQILKNMRLRADAESQQRSELERRNKIKLQEFLYQQEQARCSSLDKVSRLQQQFEELKRSHALGIERIEKDYRVIIDRVERDHAFEVKKRIQESLDSHTECQAQRAEEERRFLAALRRLTNIQDGLNRGRKPEPAATHVLEDQEVIVIEDSDEGDQWS